MPEAESEQLLQACPSCGTLLDVSDQEPFAQVHCPICGGALRVQRQFNHYELQEVLGAGGMGTVYKALDVNLNRLVALKLLRKEFGANEEFTEKFRREAAITASINHPYVVKVFSCGSDHGVFYIAMELVDKGSLDDLMNLQQRVAEPQVLEVGTQAAQGLQAAFKSGLIHRDVKPGNILFADAHTAKIVDFGLALLMEQEAESRGEIWGTPYYVAPEKLDNKPEDFRSDIYSLGATLFHAVAGRPPFEAENASLVALKHLKSQSVSLQAFAPDVSSPTAFVINRMLHKDPEQRYQSYDELIEHLTYARSQLVDEGVKSRQKARVVVEDETQMRVMTWLVLGVIIAIIGVGAVLFLNRETFFKREDAAEPPGVTQKTQLANFQEQYEQARRTLLEGDFASAEQAFAQIAEREEVEQPLRNWAAFHRGMSALLAGQLQEARSIFRKMYEAGLYSEEAGQIKLANFFVETARLMGTADPVPPVISSSYNKQNVEALSLLVFGLKNWELSQFEDAAALFREFTGSNPQEPYGWIADYKPLAEKYLADAKAAGKVSDAIRGAGGGRDALEKIEQLQSDSQVGGRLAESLREKKKELEQQLAEQQRADSERRAAEQARRQAEELVAWKAASAQAEKLSHDMKFKAARELLEKLELTEPGAAAEHRSFLKRLDWLSSFKELLISDFRSRGYSGTLSTRTGARLEGAISQVADENLELTTRYGSIPLRWEQITPSSLLEAARHFINDDRRPQRLWLAGVFAREFGISKEGREMLIEASQQLEQYRNDLPMFFEVAEVR